MTMKSSSCLLHCLTNNFSSEWEGEKALFQMQDFLLENLALIALCCAVVLPLTPGTPTDHLCFPFACFYPSSFLCKSKKQNFATYVIISSPGFILISPRGTGLMS